MIFLSAGHHLKDPGAIGVGGVKEADLTMELRNLIMVELSKKGVKAITDDDRETLGQYLSRIKPGTGSVVCEIHFNAGPPTATGVEVVIPSRGGDAQERAKEAEYGAKIAAAISKHTGLKLRGTKGVITEAQSHRGSLGLMREEGINLLVEVCFITSQLDLSFYKRFKERIAADVAAILIEADAWRT